MTAHLPDRNLLIGIDIGGTFTDLAVIDEDGTVRTTKTPTTKRAPAEGALTGLALLQESIPRLPHRVHRVAHGTTVAINAVIERTGPRLGLLTTAGFGDVLELRRLRAARSLELNAMRSPALVPRHLVREVDERTTAGGDVLRIVDAEGLRNLVAELVDNEQVEGLVIAFLHSYVEPANERRAKAIVRAAYPGLSVTCSNEIWPEIGEYERTMTAVLNAYVSPGLGRYIDDLADRLLTEGINRPLYISLSNGGVAPVQAVRDLGVTTLFSGPASGVTAARSICSRLGFNELITLDLGGTSTDIALVQGGNSIISSGARVGEWPVLVPGIEVVSIGSGGGSIARIDSGGRLAVGPYSAGSEPGPACYGRGGHLPTLTDALFVCGFLDREELANGQVKLHGELASDALASIGRHFGWSPGGAAAAIIEVALAQMHGAIRGIISVKGIDPRAYSLVAYGGAGPLLACRLASDLRLARVLVPAHAGALCALGAAIGDVRRDFVRTIRMPLTDLNADAVHRWVDDLARRCWEWMRRAEPRGVGTVAVEATLRRRGQAAEISIPVPWQPVARSELSQQLAHAFGPAALRERFESEFAQIYGSSQRGGEIDLLRLRAAATVSLPRPVPMPSPNGTQRAAPPVVRELTLYGDVVRAVVHRGNGSLPDRIVGPSLIERSDTTVFIPAAWEGRTGGAGDLVIERTDG
jgi:N-methylhydantoinase A